MNTLIALFRGINVGGHNKLPMAVLRELLAEIVVRAGDEDLEDLYELTLDGITIEPMGREP